jgi:hypothetical protein
VSTKLQWREPTSDQAAARRAGGRRHYNAGRRWLALRRQAKVFEFWADWGGLRIPQRLIDHLGLPFRSNWADQARMARLLGVHPSTISRDLQTLLRGAAEPRARTRARRDFEAVHREGKRIQRRLRREGLTNPEIHRWFDVQEARQRAEEESATCLQCPPGARKPAWRRGLCGPCYCCARASVEAGQTTWGRLEAEGRASPTCQGGADWCRLREAARVPF